MTPEISPAESKTNKIFSLEYVSEMVAKEKADGKTIGLVTGCFDVLHVGHIDLFRYAKQHVDVLVVGVERDETLKSKGSERPINILDWRCRLLSELISVDLIFSIEFVIEYVSSDEVDELYVNMYQIVNPDFLITNPIADNYWKQKQQRAERMGIGFLGLESERQTSSTDIINKIQNDI